MNDRIITPEFSIFSAKGATGTGLAFACSDFQHIGLCLSSSGSAAFTIKFQGSNADTCPDFSAAVTNTNRWGYIQVKDLNTNAAIDGSTGVAYAADGLNQYEANVNGMKWICATITLFTQGAVSLRATGFTNA